VSMNVTIGNMFIVKEMDLVMWSCRTGCCYLN
jgi:hypothetical protein